MEYYLEVQNICKNFGGIRALDNVSIEFTQGEVHCLVGENGAGKSTLGKIIAGIHHADGGDIYIDRKKIDKLTSLKAKHLKISMVMQELNLMPNLTIAENIYMLEDEAYKGGTLYDRKLINKKAECLLENFELYNFPAVTTKVAHLTIAEMQIVEILNAISHENKIIIFDEPTASLSSHEIDQLFKLIHKMKANETVVILITHKFNEIFEIGDIVTVLCDGRIVKKRIPIQELDEYRLVKLMVGRDITDFFSRKEDLKLGKPVLEVKNISDHENRVHDVSFTLHQHEVIGIGGLVGSGRTEIVETIFGIRRMKSGDIFIHHKKINKISTRRMIKEGMALIPEDRKIKGLCINLSISLNMCLAGMAAKKRFILNENQYSTTHKKMIEQLRIKISNVLDKVTSLSGGNQQKVLLSKWFSINPDIIIFDEPTRGIDVGTKTEIYKLIGNLAKEGKSIIVVSSEMRELIEVCDRILVVNNGSLTGELMREEATEEKILEYAIQAR